MPGERANEGSLTNEAQGAAAFGEESGAVETLAALSWDLSPARVTRILIAFANLGLVIFGVLSSPQMRAQAQAAAAPVLEEASVKPAPTSENQGSFAGNRITMSATTLASAVRFAYNLRRYQVLGGPSWINEDSYEIVAKGEENRPLTVDQFRQLLQTVLAERFRLIARRETRELPVYAMVVGAKGPRLKESKTGQFSMRGGQTQIDMSGGTMTQLSATLAGIVDRPVLDKTELKQKYDFKLEFAPETRAVTPDTAPLEPSTLPSIFTAVQEQLGLKLEPTRGPVEVLVIERVERPSPN